MTAAAITDTVADTVAMLIDQGDVLHAELLAVVAERRVVKRSALDHEFGVTETAGALMCLSLCDYVQATTIGGYPAIALNTERLTA